MQSVRSVTGCWTCRLRRKKCDEKLPRCARCASHDLVCHGYGQRPIFMDRGEKEKNESDKVKRIVSRNARRRRAAAKLAIDSIPVLHSASSSQRSSQDQALRTTSSIELSSNTKLSRMTETNMSHIFEVESTFQSKLSTLTNTSAGTTQAHDGGVSSFSLAPVPEVSLAPSLLDASFRGSNHARMLACSIQVPGFSTNLSQSLLDAQEKEASLLMHYLDRVFPIQYRFYRPSEIEDGRGWLLALLTRTKPLYHAALSLSALHLQVLRNIRAGERKGRGGEESVDLFKHHDMALKELQQFIHLQQQGEDVRAKVQILACTVQLISFELFKGGTYNWEIHLHAAVAVASDLISHSFTTESHNFESPESTQIGTDMAVTFMCGVALWMDTLSTITIGKRPLLFEHQDKLLATIKMEKIIGCRNWVISCISKTSDLGERKKISKSVGPQQDGDFIQHAHLLNDCLKSGIKDIVVEAGVLKKGNAFPGTEDYDAYIVCVITRTYAAAALVYLQTTIRGAHSAIPEVRSAVKMTIAALREVPDPQMVRWLIWPLVVAGCMASDDEQTFFEDRILGGGKSGLAFGNSSACLEIMKKCWELRASNAEYGVATFDWKAAMDSLNVRILCL